MTDNKNIDYQKIEDIEEYYLSVITRYLGADPEGLIQNLENHNKTWSHWYPKLSDNSKKNFFDTGAERVVYMLLNRGDILGDPNANPVGADNSFLKYDKHFNTHLAINIDVKAIKANTNIGDFLGNTPIGINQNSYKSCIEYYTQGVLKELRQYTPGLDSEYEIDGDKYLNITYSIDILYCEEPIGEEPTEQRVIGIITNCIPNGKLYDVYGDKVFNAGKTGGLKIDAEQKIYLPNGVSFDSDGTETMDSIIKKYHIKKEDYQRLNGKRKIRWNVDARFNYKDIKFSTLESVRKNRVKKIFLNQELFSKYFYHVDKNEERPEDNPRQRGKPTIESFEFINNLKFF